VLVVAVVLVGGGAVWAVVRWLDHSARTPMVAACTATADGASSRLSPTQADNAALIAAVALRRGLPAHAVTIALATALQESKLSNLDHGDLDSLGLFQQRPSQGWGTPAQVMDPIYATNAFYDRLVKVPNYTTIPVAQAAQAVQRSAFPDAYAAHEAPARAFASALTGWTTSALTCVLPAATAAGSPAAVVARVGQDFGTLPSSATAATAKTPATVTLDASALSPDSPARGAWAVAQWSVATANTLGIDRVAVAGQVWTRAGAWRANADPPVPAGHVLVTLAAPAAS